VALYQYIFDPVAADEYEEAFKWYEQRSEIAADNLLLAVKEVLTAVCSNPHRYKNTYADLREIALKKYPYNIIYYTDDAKKTVVITSFYHHKRNPKDKYRKKRK